MPISCWFYCYSSVVSFEIRDSDTCSHSFIIQDTFSYPGSFVFLYKAQNSPLSFHKHLSWNFYGNGIESVDWLDMVLNFTILILLIHEHRRTFHLLISLSVSSMSWSFYLTNISLILLEILKTMFVFCLFVCWLVYLGFFIFVVLVLIVLEYCKKTFFL